MFTFNDYHRYIREFCFFCGIVLLVLMLPSVSPAEEGRHSLEGGGNFANEVASLVAPLPQEVLDEQTLLKRYLEEVEKRSAVDVKSELAKIGFQREVLQEYTKRWWIPYDEKTREQKIREYWERYSQGQKYAESIMAQGRGEQACTLLRNRVDGEYPNAREKAKAIASQALPAQPSPSQIVPEDFLMTEAFRRGVASAYPECFIKDPTEALRALDRKLQQLQATLSEIQKKVSLYKPTDGELRKISKKLKMSLLSVIDRVVSASVDRLKVIATRDAALIDELVHTADVIRMTIGCDKRVDASGRKMPCAVTVVPPAREIDLNSTYRILLANHAIGPFQADVRMESLSEAIRIYLTDIKPGDAFVREELQKIHGILDQAERRMNARMSNLKRRVKLSIDDALVEFQLSNGDLWKSYFPIFVTETVVNDLFLVRAQILIYERFNIGTDPEARLLETIKGNYESVLQTAANIELDLSLPGEELTVELGDDEGTLATLSPFIQTVPAGYLMGYTREDVAMWKNVLTLQKEDGQ